MTVIPEPFTKQQNFRLVQVLKLQKIKHVCVKKLHFLLLRVENIVGKKKLWENEKTLVLLFIRPSKTGRIMGSPMAGGVHFFVWSISPKLF